MNDNRFNKILPLDRVIQQSNLRDYYPQNNDLIIIITDSPCRLARSRHRRIATLATAKPSTEGSLLYRNEWATVVVY